MEKIKYIIPDYLNKQRVDKAIAELLPNSSRSQIQKAIKTGLLYINNNPALSISAKVFENDLVELSLCESDTSDITPSDIPLDIVYEDEDVIVINKDSNTTVHPGAGNHTNTLVNALLFYTQNLSSVGGEFRPGIVHRLDKTTSGLMIVAKNNFAHISLADQIKNDELIRKYKALVWGIIKPTEGTIDLNIGRSKLDRKRMGVYKVGGKHAITHYKTLEILVNGQFSFVECQLETGRTHQIRVHLSHLGHSIVGDQTYGNNARKLLNVPDDLRDILTNFNHQALHSYYISFIHPTKKVRLEFEKELPNDYNRLLESIRSTLDKN